MKSKSLLAIVFSVSILIAGSALGQSASVTPVMIGLFSPAQVPTPEYAVQGMRLSLIYGDCAGLNGLDVGFVSHIHGDSISAQLGGVNLVEGMITGLQFGFVNYGDRVKALQVGLYNGGDDVSGVQIGLINHSKMMRGCQIGFINVIEKNDVPFLPLFNCFF